MKKDVVKLRKWHRNKGKPISDELQEKAIRRVEDSLNELLFGKKR